MARRKEKRNNPVKLRGKNNHKASIKATHATKSRNHKNAKRLQGALGRQQQDDTE